MKACTKCGETKLRSEFYKKRAAQDGLDSWCKTCSKASSRAWKEANLERNRANARTWYQNNPERAKKRIRGWQKANPGRHKRFVKAWKEVNQEAVKAIQRAYWKRHPDKALVANSRRRARKLRACPPWARNCPDIAKIYKIAANLRAHGFDVHVDHIIPLKPADPNAPRGLHVAANLQILPAEVNLRKSNKVGV